MMLEILKAIAIIGTVVLTVSGIMIIRRPHKPTGFKASWKNWNEDKKK